MTMAWATPCPSHTSKLVLMALADNANDQHVCWPSIGYLAVRCDLSEQGIRAQIRKLEEVELVKVERNKGRLSNRYIILPLHKGRSTDPARGAGLDETNPARGAVSTLHAVPSTLHAVPSTLHAVQGNHKEPSIESIENQEKSASAPLPLPSEAQIWNERMGNGFSQVLAWSPKRDRLLAARRREPIWQEKFEVALAKIKANDFLSGRNDRGWRASFDWLLAPDSLLKVLEGKYIKVKPEPKFIL